MTQGQVRSVHRKGFTALPSIACVPAIPSVTCVTSLCECSDPGNAETDGMGTHTPATSADLDTTSGAAAVSRVSSLPRADSLMSEDELPSRCTVCGTDVERYFPAGIASCAEHFPGEDSPSHAPMSSEQFMAIVERIAAVFAGGCTVHVDAPGYTLDEHVKRGEQENCARVRQAVLARYGRPAR
jgi:hypothetical protein